MKKFNVGDLVRYRQGSIDRKGMVIGQTFHGDYKVMFFGAHDATACRWRCLEVISESR